MSQPFPPDSAVPGQETGREEEDVFALQASSAQNRLWFLEQWESGNYNIFISVGMKGDLDREALQRALQECIRRHEALRTVFKVVDGELMQIILQDMPFDLSIIDLRQFSRDIQSGKIRRLFREDFRRPFDLEQGPLLRATILLVREGVAVLMLSMHHIISDGWSMEVLFQEVKTLYAAYVLDQPSPLPELSLQYADYTIWQNEWLQGEEMQAR